MTKILKKIEIYTIIIFLFVNFLLSCNSLSHVPTQMNDIRINSLITHPAISIISDNNFTDYGFDGNGSDVSPYLIEDLNITTTAQFGIYIDNVTKTFIIKDCYINAQDYGIWVMNIANENVIIESNTLFNNSLRGINSLYCQGIIINNNIVKTSQEGIASSYSKITISNNYCENSTNGIWLNKDNSTVVGNECRLNDQRGIYVRFSYYAEIIDNTCYENRNSGIIVSFSEFISLDSNICYRNSHGIGVDFSPNITIINNDCSVSYFGTYGFGIAVDSCDYAFIHKNKISNYPDNTGLLVSSSQFSTISNNTLTNARGISLTAQSHNSTIKYNMCIQGLIGINVFYTDFCKILFNLVQENSNCGISLEHVNFAEVHHNSFIDNVNQASDNDGSNNVWYDLESLEGNFWSDYSGPGSYTILGNSGSEDLYPLGSVTIDEFNLESSYILFVMFLTYLSLLILIRQKKSLKLIGFLLYLF